MNSLAHCSRGSIVATFVFPALLLLVSVVGSIPINGIARGTKSDLILVNRIPAPGHRGGIRSQQTRPSGTRPLKVPAGITKATLNCLYFNQYEDFFSVKLQFVK